MKKRKKTRRWILLGVGIIVIAAVIAVAMRPKDGSLPVTVEDADRGDITSVVTATGKIHPVVEVRISSEVSGEIIELPVKDGQRVERGEILARINPDTLEAQVAQQEASLRAARAQSAQARAQYLQAQLDLRRVEDLHERGFATRDQLDQAKTRVEIERASQEASGFRIEQREMQLKEARDLLGKTTIHAPMSGTVTRLNAEPGDRVVGTGQFEGTEIMRVANLDAIEVRVDVSESDIIDVKGGDRAFVEIDAIPDKRFAGRVTEIANMADTSGDRSQEQLTTFLVRVLLDEPPVGVRPGMTATADIETETVTGVVRVPLQSVTVRRPDIVRAAAGADAEDTTDAEATDRADTRGHGDGATGRARRDTLQRVVFVVRDGTAQLRKVTTGIANTRSIEITSGLEAGETVVTGSHSVLTRELEHGSTVRVETSEADRGGPRRSP